MQEDGRPKITVAEADLIIEAEFAGSTVKVHVTPYCSLRMKLRDVCAEDIQQLIALPISKHGPGKEPDRREVNGKVGHHSVTLVYRRMDQTNLQLLNVLRERSK